MYWFAIETSSPSVSMAWGRDSTCLRAVSEEGNASALVEPLFRELKMDLGQIEQCVIGQGPGSYNGLRVGYAFLKGLLCLVPLPIVQVSTPLILAQHALEKLGKKNAAFLILNNARRGEIYGALIHAQDGRLHLQWETIDDEKALFPQLPSHLDAIVSYDYTAKDLPALGCHTWVSLFPTALVAGQVARQLKLLPAKHLSELEPRYIRVAVPPKTGIAKGTALWKTDH